MQGFIFHLTVILLVRGNSREKKSMARPRGAMHAVAITEAEAIFWQAKPPSCVGRGEWPILLMSTLTSPATGDPIDVTDPRSG